MKHEDLLGILHLPSGPGLSSGPARAFLAEVFASRGRARFWHEPSVARGDAPPADPETYWESLFDSIEAAIRTLPKDFVFVTESFGSVMAEEFVRRKGTRVGGHTLRGMLHTPPVMDLKHAFRTILRRGAVNLRDDGRIAEAVRLEKAEGFTRLDDPELHAGLDIAFTHPAVMAAYFRRVDGMAKWAEGFGLTPADAPDNRVRDAVLIGMERVGAIYQVRFDSPVLTEVCVGALDPYGPVRPPTTAVRWSVLPASSHYPYVDEPAYWATKILDPFLLRAAGAADA